MVRPTPRQRIAVWAFLLLWLAPMGYGGLTGRPAIKRPLLCRDVTSVACLFAASMRTWPVYWVQERRGDGRWELLDDRAFFRLEPFGHRTRMDRLLFAAGLEGHEARAHMADWILDNYARFQPDRRPPDEIRFVATWIAVKNQPPPEGAWVRPSVEDIAPNHLRVLSTHAHSRRGGAP